MLRQMALTAEYDSVLCLQFFSLKIIITTLFIFILFFVPITNFPYGTRFLGVISTRTLMIFNQFQFIFPSDQPLRLHWNSLFPVSAHCLPPGAPLLSFLKMSLSSF